MWERESKRAWRGMSLGLLLLVFSAAACAGRSRVHASSQPTGAGGDGSNGDGGASSGGPSDGCSCPEPPSGTWVVDPSCVYRQQLFCAPSLRDQLAVLVAAYGGFWSRGCGRSVVLPQSSASPTACVYDGTGAFVGAFRSEPMECPGVDALETADVAGACAEDTTCWVGPDIESDVAHCDDVSSMLSPECNDYDQSSLSQAYERVGGQPDTTLESYLASLSDPTAFSALVGCGITAIRWYGLGSTSVVFGDNGELIGFDLFGDYSYGPCRTSDYRRGVVPPNGCDDYQICKIERDGGESTIVCGP